MMSTPSIQSSGSPKTTPVATGSEAAPVSSSLADLTPKEKLQQAIPHPASEYPPLHVNCACGQCTFELPNPLNYGFKQITEDDFMKRYYAVRNKALFNRETSVTSPPSTSDLFPTK
jgi:hypothetical protein